ncbi:MAG: right-handed parallel beta-helix repeat-containing protein [Fibrobacterota bacterium]
MIAWICPLAFLIIACTAKPTDAKLITVPSSNYRNITKALMDARPDDSVLVKPGVYREQIVINSGITLISEEHFAAVVKGNGRNNTVTIVGDGRIIGFDISHGVSGIFTRSGNAYIKECRIYKNRGSGILCAGGLPIIEDCVIVFNEGSGIQAFDIGGGTTSISHNTIAYNSNNGILITSSVPVQIKSNIIAKNRSVAISFEGKPDFISMKHNVLYDNHGMSFEIPEGNYSFNPLFEAPKKRSINFSLHKDSRALNRGKNGEDLGARINNIKN